MKPRETNTKFDAELIQALRISRRREEKQRATIQRLRIQRDEQKARIAKLEGQ